jgi:hypothetical protein
MPQRLRRGCGETRRPQRADAVCVWFPPTDALVWDLVATLVSGLVPTNVLATTATGNPYRVAFTSWAHRRGPVRYLSRLLLFEKPTHDWGRDHAAAALDRRSLKMVRIDHHGQEPAGPMAITLGYQVKSVERHRFHIRVISVLRDCARSWHR